MVDRNSKSPADNSSPDKDSVGVKPNKNTRTADRLEGLSAAYDVFIASPKSPVVSLNEERQTNNQKLTVSEKLPQEASLNKQEQINQIGSELLTESEKLIEQPKQEGQDKQDKQDKQDLDKSDKPEDLDHAERTRLGRNVKEMKDKLDLYNLQNEELKRQNAEILKTLQEIRNNPQKIMDNSSLSVDEVSDTIVTTDDLLKVLAAKSDKVREIILKDTPWQEAKEKKIYQESYVANMGNLLESLKEDKDTYNSVYKLMTEDNSPFNQIITRNPVKDSSINFSAALKKILAEKLAKPLDPQLKLRQEKPTAPTSIPESSRAVTPESPLEKEITDPSVLDFLKKTGRSKEWAQKALNKPGNFWNASPGIARSISGK